MKSKKCRTRNVPNPAARATFAPYENAFKKTVIGYTESNKTSIKRYGVSEPGIKRWRKLRSEPFEKPKPTPRRSQRNTSHSSSSSTMQGTTESNREDRSQTDKSVNDLDSMPLQQRLSQNVATSHNPSETASLPEPVLQSQPISPTKLKVTRQGAKPPVNYPKTVTPAPSEEICIKWDSHHLNMQSAFPNLLLKGQYVDATLVSEGKTLKCHRMILSSCSPYFEEILNDISPLQHPVLFMKDIPFWILKALCDFMYAGEVHILQEKLQELLAVAITLKIKGLTGNKKPQEDANIPAPVEIKQELDVISPAVKKDTEKVLKEGEQSFKEQGNKHDLKQDYRAKRKEDRKSKHLAPKEVSLDEPAPKLVPKVPQKILQKIIPKGIPKVCNPKTTIKNASKATTSKTTSRKNERHKQESILPKEKEKEKPLKKNEHINDPLDLLQPVYEEITKEEPLLPIKSTSKINPARLRENKTIPIKKSVKKVKEESTRKKVKKRRYADYCGDREESPSPTFQSRKGTRSRPNVKIPKFFHTSYEDSPKESTSATIVRVPHTDQNDPLIGTEMDTIKAEPLDVDENTIEVEENIVTFMTQDQEITSQEGEEIIGSYDSPIVNIRREAKRNTPNFFKKILVSDPVIMDVHTVTEGEQTEVRLLNEGSVEIVDIAKIGREPDQVDDPIDRSSFDPLGTHTDRTSLIKISNVQSIADTVKNELFDEPNIQSDENLATTITEDSQQDMLLASVGPDLPELNEDNFRLQKAILEVKAENVLHSENSSDIPFTKNPNLLRGDAEEMITSSQSELNFKIESVVSEGGEELDKADNNTPAASYSSSLGGLLNQIDSLNFNSPDNRSQEVENFEKSQTSTNDEQNECFNLRPTQDILDECRAETIGLSQENSSQNTEKMSIDTKSQDTLDNLNLDKLEILSTPSGSQTTVIDQIEKPHSSSEATLEHIVRNKEEIVSTTESLEILPTTNSPTGDKIPVDNNEQPNIHLPANTLIEEGMNKLEPEYLEANQNPNQTDYNPSDVNAENEPGKESSKDIGAELAECLASTSDIPQVKLIEDAKLKPLDLPFEEDLTSNMQCDSLSDKTIATNVVENECESNIPISNLNMMDTIDINLDTTKNEIIKDSNVEPKCTDPSVNININHKDYAHNMILEETLPLDAIAQDLEKIEPKEVLKKPDIPLSSTVVKSATDDLLTNTNITTTLNPAESTITASFSTVLPVELPLPEEHLLGHSPQPTDDPTQDDDKLEESLLELDEDIIMKDACATQRMGDNPEKTLEMIVNDLNESLGCSEK